MAVTKRGMRSVAGPSKGRNTYKGQLFDRTNEESAHWEAPSASQAQRAGLFANTSLPASLFPCTPGAGLSHLRPRRL